MDRPDHPGPSRFCAERVALPAPHGFVRWERYWELLRVNLADGSSTADVLLEIVRGDQPSGAREKDYLRVTAYCVRFDGHQGIAVKNGDVGFMDVIISRSESRIRFGPSDNLQIREERLRGRGLGKYMFSWLIEFANSEYPHFSVDSLKLSDVDATNEATKKQRNAFYRELGFELRFDDESEKSGYASARSPATLKTFWSGKHIKRLQLANHLRELAENASILDQASRSLASDVNRQQLELEQAKRIQKWLALAVVVLGTICVATW